MDPPLKVHRQRGEDRLEGGLHETPVAGTAQPVPAGQLAVLGFDKGAGAHILLVLERLAVKVGCYMLSASSSRSGCGRPGP